MPEVKGQFHDSAAVRITNACISIGGVLRIPAMGRERVTGRS